MMLQLNRFLIPVSNSFNPILLIAYNGQQQNYSHKLFCVKENSKYSQE